MQSQSLFFSPTTKILPDPLVTSTAGNSYKYVSKLFGGSKKRKTVNKKKNKNKSSKKRKTENKKKNKK